jgi:hypothetical protein
LPNWYQSCRFTLTTVVALKKCFQDKIGQTNEFTKCVEPVKVGLEHKALGTYKGTVRWLLIYMGIGYNPNLQHYFLSKLKFMYNPTLLFVTTPSMVR